VFSKRKQFSVRPWALLSDLSPISLQAYSPSLRWLRGAQVPTNIARWPTIKWNPFNDLSSTRFLLARLISGEAYLRKEARQASLLRSATRKRQSNRFSRSDWPKMPRPEGRKWSSQTRWKCGIHKWQQTLQLPYLRTFANKRCNSGSSRIICNLSRLKARSRIRAAPSWLSGSSMFIGNSAWWLNPSTSQCSLWTDIWVSYRSRNRNCIFSDWLQFWLRQSTKKSTRHHYKSFYQ